MRPKILVVDDEEAVRASVALLLREQGFDAETAASGEEAVEAVRRSLFHLVFLDLRMDGMGGLEALRRMKQHDPELPVIVLTGDSDIESAKKAMQLGAADYLCKPTEPRQILGRARQTVRYLSGVPEGKVLVVEDDPLSLRSVLALLEGAEIPAEGFVRADQALLKASLGEGQVLLTDLRLADVDGLRLISKLREVRPDMASIVFTGHPSLETTIEAMRLGAMDYIQKPVQPDQLLQAVRRALDQSRWTHLPGGVRLGNVYGMSDRQGASALLSSLITRGFAGMWATRNPPERRSPRPNIAMFYVGNPGGSPLPSILTPEQLVQAAEQFCDQRKCAILFDALEFFATHSGFDATYRALCALRDIVTARDSILLVCYRPGAFTERERDLLRLEMTPLDEKGPFAVWEARAAELSGDERTIYDLVRTAGGQWHQADLAVATQFSKAKITRLLDRMERNGLLRRQRDGMGNRVVLL